MLLKSAHVSSAIDAAATAAEDDALSTSYHAGLAALHDSSYYTLPPAILPDEPADMRIARRIADEHAEDDSMPHVYTPVTRGGSSAADCALLSYGSTLQPLMPAPSSESFAWSSYVTSLAYRLYARAHPVWPRGVNGLHSGVIAVWTRRATIIRVIFFIIGWKALVLIARFFRLESMPGATLLMTELRNFLKIAFISGTGRSLFA
jgi:hypothetical protein